MRLANVERGHLADRVFYFLFRQLSGFRAPDVIRTLRYRKTFFGAWHSAYTQTAMRGASAWSAGECELFAAFVSRLNQCHF